MSDDFDVEVASLWDGRDQQESRLAELKLRFLDLDLPMFWQESQYLLLLIELERELQPIADTRFGEGRIRVESKELREGSVAVVVALTAVGGALYAFFKDYKNLREGVLLFVKDVKAISSDLQKIMRRHIKHRNKNGGKPSAHKGTRGNDTDKGGRGQ